MMRTLSIAIAQERYKNKQLQQLAIEKNLDGNYEKSMEIRKAQNQSYKKWEFLNNLNKAMCRGKNINTKKE